MPHRSIPPSARCLGPSAPRRPVPRPRLPSSSPSRCSCNNQPKPSDTLPQKKKKKKKILKEERKTHPAIFSRDDLVASSPQSMIFRPMTSWMSGLTTSAALLGPPIAKTSFPSTAIGLPPNTGAARNEACFSFSLETVRPTVCGWTVEQSTKILSLSEWPDSTAVVMRLLSTVSLEICVVYYYAFRSLPRDRRGLPW